MAEEECKGWQGRKRTLTAEEAKDILMNRKQKLEDIGKKIALLCEENGVLEKADELLKAAALPAREVNGVAEQVRYGDNLMILNRFYRQRRERRMEIRMQIWKLSREIEEIRRLWSCFFLLQEPYYGILHELYIKKELYAVTEASFGLSHRMFEKRRREGLERLAAMFNSPHGSLKMMEMDYPWKHGMEAQPTKGKRE